MGRGLWCDGGGDPGTGDAKAGRAALNTPAVITALELDPSPVVT